MTEPAFDDMDKEPREVRAKGSRTVRPRHAATLIIIRRDSAEPRVLMGRRHAGHDFMPDKWVFPGGRIDPADYTAPSATELRPDVAARVQMTAPAAKARALAMAAVRETFEEAGLLLAKSAPAIARAGPWREFLAQGARPDLAALTFVAQAITPPSRHKRFNARFFMADAEHLISLDRQGDCGELDEIAWFGLDDALRLDLPGITRFVLRETPLRLADPGRPVPSMQFTRGQSRLRHL